jgi:hypothetical protein
MNYSLGISTNNIIIKLSYDRKTREHLILYTNYTKGAWSSLEPSYSCQGLCLQGYLYSS